MPQVQSDGVMDNGEEAKSSFFSEPSAQKATQILSRQPENLEAHNQDQHNWLVKSMEPVRTINNKPRVGWHMVQVLGLKAAASLTLLCPTYQEILSVPPL